MHFQDLVAIIGISAAAGVASYMKFFRKYKFTTEGLDPAKQFTVEFLLKVYVILSMQFLIRITPN